MQNNQEDKNINLTKEKPYIYRPLLSNMKDGIYAHMFDSATGSWCGGQKIECCTVTKEEFGYKYITNVEDFDEESKKLITTIESETGKYNGFDGTLYWLKFNPDESQKDFGEKGIKVTKGFWSLEDLSIQLEGYFDKTNGEPVYTAKAKDLDKYTKIEPLILFADYGEKQRFNDETNQWERTTIQGNFFDKTDGKFYQFVDADKMDNFTIINPFIQVVEGDKIAFNNELQKWEYSELTDNSLNVLRAFFVNIVNENKDKCKAIKINGKSITINKDIITLLSNKRMEIAGIIEKLEKGDENVLNLKDNGFKFNCTIYNPLNKEFIIDFQSEYNIESLKPIESNLFNLGVRIENELFNINYNIAASKITKISSATLQELSAMNQEFFESEFVKDKEFVL